MKTKLFTIVGAILLTMASLTTEAQNVVTKDVAFYNTYNWPSTNLVLTDTITNTAVGRVRTRIMKGFSNETTIVATVLEISGTTGGTLLLRGSLDGTNWVSIPTEETATAIATYSPADVATAQSFSWRLKRSPYLYYEVQYTGTGTMSATLAARLFAH